MKVWVVLFNEGLFEFEASWRISKIFANEAAAAAWIVERTENWPELPRKLYKIEVHEVIE